MVPSVSLAAARSSFLLVGTAGPPQETLGIAEHPSLCTAVLSSDLRLLHGVARVCPGISKHAGAIPGHSSVFCPPCPACTPCLPCLQDMLTEALQLAGAPGGTLWMLWCCGPLFPPHSRCLVPSGRSRTATGSGEHYQGGEVCSDRTAFPFQLLRHSIYGFKPSCTCSVT